MSNYYDENGYPVDVQALTEEVAKDVAAQYEPQLAQQQEQIAFLAAHQQSLAALNQTVAAEHERKVREETDRFATEAADRIKERFGSNYDSVSSLLTEAAARIPEETLATYDTEQTAEAVVSVAATIASERQLQQQREAERAVNEENARLRAANVSGGPRWAAIRDGTVDVGG